MNTHTAHLGSGLHTLRAAFHLPQLRAERAQVPQPGWLERLAVWAERQPAHRHLGSYNRSC